VDIEQLAGTKLGNYEIESLLGRGGMGVVYKARQMSLDRSVALKILPPSLSSDSSFVKRFKREARAVAKFSHSNIIQIFDITEEQDLHFFSMEYVEGKTLDKVLEEKGTLEPNEAVKIISQAALALEHAHKNNIIHRDVKPSNIIVDDLGNVKVMDFGLARALDERSRVTQSGALVGTLGYMSPEQCCGKELDFRTDIYSLGVMLYEMITGNDPFDADSAPELIHKIVYDEPTDVRILNPDLPAAASIIISRAMAKKTEDRYASISAFLGDIALFESQEVRGHVPGEKLGSTRPMTLPKKKYPAAVVVLEESDKPVITQRTPFVGRENEQANLRRYLERARDGQGALVMIGGEPGVGKTRITEELVDEAHNNGFLTFTGHCYESEGAPSYIPFVEIIESVARMVEPHAMLTMLDDDAPEVAKLVPELRQRFPDIPAPKQLPPEQERRRMFNGILEFTARAARTHPILLVIEDLHWADDSTLLLLQHFAQRLQEMPVLMVGTYRDTELDFAGALAKSLQEFLRQHLAHDILLKRLPELSVSAMLRGRSGREPPPGLVEFIYKETEGNPFFVEEVFRHLAEEAKLFDSKGQWRGNLHIEETDVPRGVLLVVGRRLERVSKECRRILARAAVIGRGVSFRLLNEVIEIDEDALLDAIEEAERAQLVRMPIIDGEVLLTFAHELIRQTLVSDLFLPRRRGLHLRVAEAMERVYADVLDRYAGDIAHHFYQAGGDAEKIIKYAVIAGTRATAQTAYEEAVDQYRRAVQMLEHQQPVNELRRCDLLLLLGRAYENAGDPPRAKETFLLVTEIARKLPAPEQFALATIRACHFLFRFGSVDRHLLSLMNNSLELLGQKDSVVRASLLGRLSYILESAGNQSGAALSEEALSIARRVGDPEALWYALFARVFLWDRPLEERIADATELAALEEKDTCPMMGEEGLTYLAHCHRAQGNFTAFEKDLVELRRRADDTQLPQALWRVRFIEAAYAQMLGRFDEAELLALEALALGQKKDEVVPAQGFVSFMFVQRYLQGRLSEVEDAFQGQAAQYPESLLYRASGMLLHLTLGRIEQAREEFERFAANNFADLPRHLLMPTYLMELSTVAAALGDRNRAAHLYILVGTCHDCVFLVGGNNACIGTKSHWLGMLAATIKRWNDAVAHFEEALEISTRLCLRPWLARTQHEYARMLIERNESEEKAKAKALLSEATPTYRELGMATFLEDAEELLSDL
jgi:tetratricopeptide (TPR) repeat protein/predicted Ser/Thr protein kinase